MKHHPKFLDQSSFQQAEATEDKPALMKGIVSIAAKRVIKDRIEKSDQECKAKIRDSLDPERNFPVDLNMAKYLNFCKKWGRM